MPASRRRRVLPIVLLLAAISASQGRAAGISSWEFVGPSNLGGRVRAISIDPANFNTIVVGAAAGGIWRSTDGGAHWAAVDDFMGSLAIGSLTRDTQNAQRVYAGTGEGFLAANARIDGSSGAGIFLSTNGGVSWSPLIGTIGWAADSLDRYVNRIAVRGSRILAATNGGIRRSTNSGISFQDVYDGWVTDLKFATRPDSGVFGDAVVAGLMTFCDDITCLTDTPGPSVCAVYSYNGGADWQPSTFVGAPSTTLSASYSSGSTLSVQSSAPFCAFDIIRVGNSPGEYAQVTATAAGSLTLNDPLVGDYPANTSVTLVPSQRTELAVVKNFPNVVFATMGAGGGTIWKSSDAGRTFRFVSNPAINWLYSPATRTRAFYDQALWVAPNDSNLVVVAGVEAFRSTNGGATIDSISNGRFVGAGTGPHTDHHAIVEDPRYTSGTRTVYFGNDGGVHRALDILAVGPLPPSNAQWQSVVEGLGVTQFYGGAATRSGGVEWYMGGGQDNGRPHLRRDVASPLDPNGWVKPFDDNLLDSTPGSGDDKYRVAIDATNPQQPILYAIVANMRVSRSDDIGDTWNDHSPADAGLGRVYSPFAMDPSENAVLYAGARQVSRSRNRGDTWTSIRSSQSDRPVSAIDVAPSDSNVVWVGYESGKVSYTTSARAASPTWFDVGDGVFPARAVNDIAIDPQDPAHVVVVFDPPPGSDPLDTVWSTSNGGACWESRVGHSGYQVPRRRILSVQIHPTDRDRIFLGTDLGVVVSHDGGLSWNQSPLHTTSEGPANVEVWDLSWQANEHLIAATNGRGLFRTLPSARTPLFTDVSATSGTADAGNSEGVAWGDFDRDGDLDLFVANHSNQASRLYRNDGTGVFTEIAAAAGVTNDRSASAAVWGDYDNDGDLDLYVTNDGAANRLYRNNGNGTFTDVAAASGTNLAAQGRGAAWGDYDHDGHLDLYVVNVGANRLYRNGGSGAFSNATSGPLGDTSSGQGAAWGDYDGDGDVDLYVANWSSQPNKLLRNDGGAFTDVSAVSGTAGASSSTGATWVDYDNDGDLDLYVVNEDSNRLYRNDGTLPFVDVSAATRTNVSGTGRSASWGDFDHDGDLDLYVSNFAGPDWMLRQDACGVFVDVTLMTGTGSTSGHRGTAWGDMDGDGDLDLYVARSGSNRLYRNSLGAPAYHRWLQIALVGNRSNRDGIGARIRVSTSSRTQLRELSGGSGLYSQESLVASFGLGTATTADIEVRWPSGVLQTVAGVTANQRITLTEPGPTGASPNLGTHVLALHANRPNPFARETTVEFALPGRGQVALSVHDVAGRRVRTLVSGTLEPGAHRAQWDGSDAEGRALGSGVYFIRLETAGGTLMRRALLLR
jgi:hypothetical protein